MSVRVCVPYELAVIYLDLQTPSPRLRSKCPRSPLDTVIRAIWPASGVYVNRVTQQSPVYRIGHLQHSESVPSTSVMLKCSDEQEYPDDA